MLLLLSSCLQQQVIFRKTPEAEACNLCHNCVTYIPLVILTYWHVNLSGY
ncbi:MAG: hypothetical protein OFPI_13700 [Osedax symbiont Rs2]|nr:MAG: hypothetical protein OFPI_13700 [Osedax symbiont Rs2]